MASGLSSSLPCLGVDNRGSLPSPCCSENQQSRGGAVAQALVRRKAAVSHC